MQIISIDEIKTNNNYLRLNTDVSKLKRSIETVGLINPVTINEENQLIAGGRRFQALKELGYNEIPVNRVRRNTELQELISIDENLVRQDLTKVEVEKNLNRGREIYEELYPKANKVEDENLASLKDVDMQEELPEDKKSFLDVTAEKTGLSKKSIKQAIDRDIKSSDKIKKLRTAGEVNASQVNEIIKLDKKSQDHIIEYVKDRPVAEVRKLVKSINTNGLEKAIVEASNSPQLTKEYRNLHNFSKRMNKLLSKILLEQMECDHPNISDILENLEQLQTQIGGLIEMHSGEKIIKNPNTEIFQKSTSYTNTAPLN